MLFGIEVLSMTVKHPGHLLLSVWVQFHEVLTGTRIVSLRTTNYQVKGIQADALGKNAFPKNRSIAGQYLLQGNRLARVLLLQPGFTNHQ